MNRLSSPLLQIANDLIREFAHYLNTLAIEGKGQGAVEPKQKNGQF
jgi:hypothetical protein